jgi:hypothetical protein
VPTQLNIYGSNQITEFHMTIQLDKFADVNNSPGKPFGAGLALQNLVPFTAFPQIVSKAKEIKAPALSAPFAVQVYHLRLLRM